MRSVSVRSVTFDLPAVGSVRSHTAEVQSVRQARARPVAPSVRTWSVAGALGLGSGLGLGLGLVAPSVRTWSVAGANWDRAVQPRVTRGHSHALYVEERSAREDAAWAPHSGSETTAGRSCVVVRCLIVAADDCGGSGVR